MDDYSSGLGELGDIAMMAAMIGRDRTDAASYARLVSETLDGVLPRDMVTVEYRRSVGDRMAGRPGRPVRITVTAEGGTFSLESDGDRLTGEARRVVGGVVISRTPLTVAEWTRRLAEELRAVAIRDDGARLALGRLLGAE
jgi:hypothetical protein